MGVVSGIVMSFQFGTNWPGYMKSVGNIAGPLLAYEVLTAFFLEATFLGVMLFGMNRVKPWMHIGATVLVAVGTTTSAFWILALNSWMQTPTGHVMDGGALIAGNWIEVIFNPSFPYRFTHMLIASGLTASFVIAGLSAWRLLKSASDKSARVTLGTAALVAADGTAIEPRDGAGDGVGGAISIAGNVLVRSFGRPQDLVQHEGSATGRAAGRVQVAERDLEAGFATR